MGSFGDAQLVVNFARLQETSGHIQSAIGTLESQLGQLERDAQPLVATWSGEARQAYQERQQSWRQASTELTTMLRAIKRALDESIVDYQSTEKHNVSLFAELCRCLSGQDGDVGGGGHATPRPKPVW